LKVRKLCPIPLGRVRLPSHLEGHFYAQGLQDDFLDYSSSWSDEIHFLSYPAL